MHWARFEIGAIGQAKARSNRPVEGTLVPMSGLNEGNRARLINHGSGRKRGTHDWCTRDEDIVAWRCIGRWVDFPTRAVVQR